MDIFENFSKSKILVVGDVMIDKFIWGNVNRISPEAPVPVVQLTSVNFVAGGAANVAANIAGLGAEVFLVGVVGDDLEGNQFPEILEKAGVSAKYLIRIPDRQTTIKTRILAHNQQIARVDQETNSNLTNLEEENLLKKIEDLIDQIEVIVLSDYKKGIFSTKLTSGLIMLGKSKNKLILVDPKGNDYSKYSGATVLTPNKFEVAEVFNQKNDFAFDLLEAGKKMVESLDLQALLITRGEEGMTLIEKNKNTLNLKTTARNVYDVTGAGDTVIASLAVAINAGHDFAHAAEIANTAAGLVVEEIGTTVIRLENLKTAFINR